jgi:hypothetical protein
VKKEGFIEFQTNIIQADLDYVFNFIQVKTENIGTAQYRNVRFYLYKHSSRNIEIKNY